MATPDRFPNHYVGPCECGHGRLVVDMTEPDYPFANLSNKNYYPRFECPTCAERFGVESRDGEIRVIDKKNRDLVRSFTI